MAEPQKNGNIFVVCSFVLTILIQTAMVSIWGGGLTNEVKNLNENIRALTRDAATKEQLSAEASIRQFAVNNLQRQVDELREKTK